MSDYPYGMGPLKDIAAPMGPPAPQKAEDDFSDVPDFSKMAPRDVWKYAVDQGVKGDWARAYLAAQVGMKDPVSRANPNLQQTWRLILQKMGIAERDSGVSS